MDIQLIRSCHPAIVFQCFRTCGLYIIGYKWNAPDFQLVRGRKKGHIERVIIKGISQAALLNNTIGEARLFGFQSAGDPNGSRTHNDQIKLINGTHTYWSAKLVLYRLFTLKPCASYGRPKYPLTSEKKVYFQQNISIYGIPIHLLVAPSYYSCAFCRT